MGTRAGPIDIRKRTLSNLTWLFFIHGMLDAEQFSIDLASNITGMAR